MGAETNASNNEPDAVKVKGGPDTIEPTDSDVLSGRGGLTNHHPGNKRYRKWVELHKDKYRKGSMNEKTKIARQIMQLVRNQSPPGRFLKRDCKTKLWFELTEERSERKTKQALRENKEMEKEDGLMPAGLRPVSATDPSAPKLLYGDPLLMAPPKLLCGEMRQNSLQMVEAVVGYDENIATATTVREHSLGAEEITTGNGLALKNFSWNNGAGGNGQNGGMAVTMQSSLADLGPMAYATSSLQQQMEQVKMPAMASQQQDEQHQHQDRRTSPQQSRAKRFQMMEMMNRRQDEDDDDDDAALLHKTRPMHEVDASVANQWASAGMNSVAAATSAMNASNNLAMASMFVQHQELMPTATASLQHHTMNMPMATANVQHMTQFQNQPSMEDFNAATLMAAPIESPFMQQNGWDGQRKRFGNNGVDTVLKRTTSNPYENEETRPLDTIKRLALNRDNSSAANRLKAMYPPASMDMYENNAAMEDEVQSLNLSMQHSSLSSQTSRYDLPPPPPPHQQSMSPKSSISSIGQLRALDHTSSVFDPLPINPNGNLVDAGPDYMTSSTALALLRASQSPGSQLKSQASFRSLTTNASLRSVMEEEIEDKGDSSKSGSVNSQHDESMGSFCSSMDIPLTEEDKKPGRLSEKDRLTTQQYIALVNQTSLTRDDSDSLSNLVDSVLRNPNQALDGTLGSIGSSWRESLDGDDDNSQVGEP